MWYLMDQLIKNWWTSCSIECRLQKHYTKIHCDSNNNMNQLYCKSKKHHSWSYTTVLMVTRHLCIRKYHICHVCAQYSFIIVDMVILSKWFQISGSTGNSKHSRLLLIQWYCFQDICVHQIGTQLLQLKNKLLLLLLLWFRIQLFPMKVIVGIGHWVISTERSDMTIMLNIAFVLCAGVRH